MHCYERRSICFFTSCEVHTSLSVRQVREEVPWRLACQGFDLLQPASAPFVWIADELCFSTGYLPVSWCSQGHPLPSWIWQHGQPVIQSSLSRANDNRDYRIYEEFGIYKINLVRPLYARISIPDVTIDNVLYSLDSTTISTSVKLATWDLGKYNKGAVKMHTLLDLRGSIPANIHITDGRWHDSNELELTVPELLAFYMMDKAYVDFDEFFRFHLAGAYWVTRPKDNMKYEIIGHRKDFSREDGIRGDFTIRLTQPKTHALYPEPFRAVCHYDEETCEEIVFITNNFEFSAVEVSVLYRHRWDIEVFFKWIKQNIVVKTLWGIPRMQSESISGLQSSPIYLLQE